MGSHRGMHGVAFVLVVIGGLNWLVYGIFGWDIVGKIFGGMEMTISRIIYIIVGLATVYIMATHKQTCKMCENGNKPMNM